MESIWRPHIKSIEDDWTTVQDAAERRRIQNRLSQRVKRAKKASLRAATQADGLSLESNSAISAISPTLCQTFPSIDNLESTMENAYTLDLLPPNPATDTSFLILQPLRCFMAFGRIIEMLQLSCTNDIKVFDTDLQLPTTLRPVLEQKTIPHLMHVDMLPWPTLRATFLKKIATINQLEFVKDMQREHLKVWGDEPWDIMGWEMSEEFVEKWSFLLDSSMLRTTNFWRRQQGLKAIIAPNQWTVAQC